MHDRWYDVEGFCAVYIQYMPCGGPTESWSTSVSKWQTREWTTDIRVTARTDMVLFGPHFQTSNHTHPTSLPLDSPGYHHHSVKLTVHLPSSEKFKNSWSFTPILLHPIMTLFWSKGQQFFVSQIRLFMERIDLSYVTHWRNNHCVLQNVNGLFIIL
jgi:hypothetical protein